MEKFSLFDVSEESFEKIQQNFIDHFKASCEELKVSHITASLIIISQLIALMMANSGSATRVKEAIEECLELAEYSLLNGKFKQLLNEEKPNV